MVLQGPFFAGFTLGECCRLERLILGNFHYKSVKWS